MAHCPYCGESVADNAAQCPKCAMILDEEAAAAAPAAAPAKELAAPAKKKKTEPCPRCEKPVPVTAHRCPACGHAVREIVSPESRAQEAAFRRNVRLGVAGAVGLIVLVLLGIGFLGGGDRPRTGEPAKVRYDELANLVGPTARASAARQKDNWLKFAGKWVRWEGRIVEIEPATLFGAGALLIRHRAGPGDADVRLAVPKAELAKEGVAVGKRVNYSGRLVAYGTSPAFTLAEGQVHSTKDPGAK